MEAEKPFKKPIKLTPNKLFHDYKVVGDGKVFKNIGQAYQTGQKHNINKKRMFDVGEK